MSVLNCLSAKAKLLWKRIPSNSKANERELIRIWEIIQYIIQRKFIQAFDAASKSSWSCNELGSLINNLIQNCKNKLFELMNVAYSSISTQEMANLLNITPQEATKVALDHGWTLDQSMLFLIPKYKG